MVGELIKCWKCGGSGKGGKCPKCLGARQIVSTGKGWKGNPDGHKAAGHKGGVTLVRNRGRSYMGKIGRVGGTAVSRDASHMAETGRKGGLANSARQDLRDSYANYGEE